MATEEDNYTGLLAIIAEIREASGLGAKPMLTELPAAIKTLLSKYAFERDDARRQRDEAQSMVQAWDNVFGTIEAHIMDRANMRDPANPELYLSIIRSDIAGIKRSSDQICAARWADYSRHEARATAAEARVAQLETALKVVRAFVRINVNAAHIHGSLFDLAATCDAALSQSPDRESGT